MTIWASNAASSRLVKALGTLAVCGLIWWSLQNPDRGILREITAFGPTVGGLVVGGFFALVVG